MKGSISVTTGQQRKRTREATAHLHPRPRTFRTDMRGFTLRTEVNGKPVALHVTGEMVKELVGTLTGRYSTLDSQIKLAAIEAGVAYRNDDQRNGDFWYGRLAGLLTAARQIDDGYDRDHGFADDQKEAKRLIAEATNQIERRDEAGRNIASTLGKKGEDDD